MSLDAWILALHLLSAFALVGALTAFSIGMLALRWRDPLTQAQALAPAMRVASIAVGIGVAGTVVFGVWLAISMDAYRLWDGWIIAALIMWAIATETGRRAGVGMNAAFEAATAVAANGTSEADAVALLRAPGAARLHWLSTGMTVLILLDMIWKPGV